MIFQFVCSIMKIYVIYVRFYVNRNTKHSSQSPRDLMHFPMQKQGASVGNFSSFFFYIDAIFSVITISGLLQGQEKKRKLLRRSLCCPLLIHQNEYLCSKELNTIQTINQAILDLNCLIRRYRSPKIPLNK